MICDNCQTELPDQAAACWKCGKQFRAPALPAPVETKQSDATLIVLTFIFSGIFFVCGGWAFPFTVWGKFVEYANRFPEWSGVAGVMSAILFIATAVGVFGLLWRGSYWLVKRVAASPSQR